MKYLRIRKVQIEYEFYRGVGFGIVVESDTISMVFLCFAIHILW